MYCSLDVELVYRVVVYHFRNCIERFAKLSQNVFVVRTHNLQVHEGVVISEEEKKINIGDKTAPFKRNTSRVKNALTSMEIKFEAEVSFTRTLLVHLVHSFFDSPDWRVWKSIES